VGDVRGFAVKVLGVEGEGALGGPARSQDFLLINRPSFSSPKSDAFMGLVEAAAKGPAAVAWYFVRTYRLRDGLRRLGATAASLRAPFGGSPPRRSTRPRPSPAGRMRRRCASSPRAAPTS
jgi:hypothetical protein